jgi:hypothetical protein
MTALLTLTPTAKLPTADAYDRTAGADTDSKAADADTALNTLRNTACMVLLLCVDARDAAAASNAAKLMCVDVCEAIAVRCCARCSEAEVRRTSRYWRRCLVLTLALHGCCSSLVVVACDHVSLRVVPSLALMLMPRPMLALMPMRAAMWTPTIYVNAALMLGTVSS